VAIDPFGVGVRCSPRHMECKTLKFINTTGAYCKQIFARRILVFLEIIGGACHVLFFFVVCITLIVMAPRSTNEFVWATTVNDVSGWTNPGVAFCLGLLSPTFTLAGMFLTNLYFLILIEHV
jgi:hypothetical protein